MENTTRTEFDEREFRAPEPLPTDAVIIVIPDSPAGIDDLTAPVQQPRPLAVPEPTEVTPAAPVAGVEIGFTRAAEYRMRWTGSDYLWFALVTTLVATIAGIVVILVNALLPVFTAVAAVVEFVVGLGSVAGPIVGGGGVLVLLWQLTRLLSRATTPTTPAVPVGKVATVVAAVKSPGKAAAAVVTGKPVKLANPPAPATVNTEDPAPARQTARSPRGAVGRFFLGDDRGTSVAAGQDLTSRWLARMRDPESGQAVGRWSGGHYDLIAAGYDVDITTAVNMASGDKCAVSWLLEEADPKGWNRRDSRGTKHGSWSDINARYGSGLIKSVIAMNDRGVPLRKIADHVERKTGR